MTVKTYTIAGVSLHKGVWAVRYANSKGRKAVLVKNGHSNVKLWAMPYAGAKEDCVHALLDMNLTGAAGEAVRVEAVGLGFTGL